MQPNELTKLKLAAMKLKPWYCIILIFEIIPSFGFNINYRWQSSFLWQSSLATGTVPAYRTVDAQVEYTFLENNVSLKPGASNLLNKYYYSFIGGPAIGGLYYLTATIHVF